MNENWQKDAPTLAAMEKTNPFSVPENYFSEMASHVNARISIEQFDNSKALFEVPEDYFEELPERILSASRLPQIEQQDDSSLFTVPDGYFDKLRQNTLSKVRAQKRPAKVRQFFSSWVTYAAAACITAVVAVGVFRSNVEGENIEAKFADIPSDEIVNYLQLYSDVGDAPVILESLGEEAGLPSIGAELSDREIEEYLKSNL